MNTPRTGHIARSALANANRQGQAPSHDSSRDPGPRLVAIPSINSSSPAAVSVNMFADAVNSSMASVGRPDPDHGALGWVQAALGGVLGVVGLAGELDNVGIALAANAIFGNGVGLPALTLGTMHVGSLHGHMHPPSLIPPAPVPVPLPSLGNISLATCASVLIGGLPAARAGDMGAAMTCGSLSPTFEIVTGSSNVFIGGARAARAMDLTLHCNPLQAIQPKAVKALVAMGAAGAVLGAVGAATSAMDSSASAAEGNAAAAAGQALAAATGAAQAALDVAALALSMLAGKDPGVAPGFGMMVPAQANVLIGGVPIPNDLQIAAPLFRAARRLAGRAMQRLRRRPGHGPDDPVRAGGVQTCPR